MNRLPDPASHSARVAESLIGAGPEGAGGATPENQAPPASLTHIDVRAMEDVMFARAQQILRHGHTPEADTARPLDFFARDIKDRGTAILETVQFHKGHDVLRRRAVKLAALCLALIDRLDGEAPDDGKTIHNEGESNA